MKNESVGAAYIPKLGLLGVMELVMTMKMKCNPNWGCFTWRVDNDCDGER